MACKLVLLPFLFFFMTLLGQKSIPEISQIFQSQHHEKLIRREFALCAWNTLLLVCQSSYIINLYIQLLPQQTCLLYYVRFKSHTIHATQISFYNRQIYLSYTSTNEWFQMRLRAHLHRQRHTPVSVASCDKEAITGKRLSASAPSATWTHITRVGPVALRHHAYVYHHKNSTLLVILLTKANKKFEQESLHAWLKNSSCGRLVAVARKDLVAFLFLRGPFIKISSCNCTSHIPTPALAGDIISHRQIYASSFVLWFCQSETRDGSHELRSCHG